MDAMLACPECGSTGDHYCHRVKVKDPDAKALGRDCRWQGLRDELKELETEIARLRGEGQT